MNWASYKAGFGNVTGEHWLGNSNIYTLSNNINKTYELRVDLTSETESQFVVYGNFSISDESDQYRITLGTYEESGAGKAI